jgi:deoxyribodipyrimidine photo-lyase
VDRCVVLFTRDLRLHDHPALYEAARSGAQVIPLFVLDPRLLRTSPNRARFLLECLADLRTELNTRGGDLLVVTGDQVQETMRTARQFGASAVYVSADVSRRAQRREARLAEACSRARLAWRAFPGVTVVPPEQLTPASRDHYRVFTPYWRAWRSAPRRRMVPAPRRIDVPADLPSSSPPAACSIVESTTSPRTPAGGEIAARRLLRSWGATALRSYPERHDLLAADVTSRISPYLHFGCVSPLELAQQFADRHGGDAFVRQLCWRDFFHQVTAAFPTMATEDYRPRADRWRHSADELDAWKEGRTGYPIVDAGMRQLREEGWMHNRARLLTASFLTKDLYGDWRAGARHFMEWLVDGDVANNSGNWQWVAGTGNDTRPHRMFNPLRQAERFDPDGDYVRRYVPELADVHGAAVHRPWLLEPAQRASLDYPPPIVDHADAVARFRAARAPR